MKKNAWIGLVVAIVAVASLIVAVLLLTAPRGDEGGNPDAGSTPAPSSNGGAQTGCNAGSSDATTPPADLSWTATDGVTWPVSETAGPTAEVEGHPACFERSRAGAALFAVNFFTTVMVGGSDLRDVVDFYTVESPGKPALLNSVPASGGNADSARQWTAGGLSIAGYKIDAYSPERVSLHTVVSVPQSATGYTGFPMTVVWSEGDWKLEPLDDGSSGQPIPVTSDEFTKWSG
ncbi:hypothetical protein [Microbacterium arborescens]